MSDSTTHPLAYSEAYSNLIELVRKESLLKLKSNPSDGEMFMTSDEIPMPIQIRGIILLDNKPGIKYSIGIHGIGNENKVYAFTFVDDEALMYFIDGLRRGAYSINYLEYLVQTEN